MKFGIVVFPGTWSERDTHHAVSEVLGQDAEFVWHGDTDLAGYNAIVLPGGFSYGDYLRAGAIARFSPIMGAVADFANSGGLVLGVCNGFQVLCEAGLLPGVLMRNAHLEFRCSWTNLRVDNAGTSFSHLANRGQVLRVPISHGEGNYQADPETIASIDFFTRSMLFIAVTNYHSAHGFDVHQDRKDHERHKWEIAEGA